MLKLASMAGSSSLVRGAIIGQVTDRITGAAAGVTQQALAWSELNWPMKQVGLLHFDLAELKEKRSEEVYLLVLNFTRWLVFILCIMAMNLLTTVVLTSLVSDYSGVNIFLCFVEAAIGGGGGLATTWFAYHGWAENAGRSKTIARVGCILLFIFCLVLAFVFGGNVNGLSGLGASARFDAATAGGTAGAVIGYWKAMMVLESLAWLTAVAGIVFLGYQSMKSLVAGVGAGAAGLASQLGGA